MNPTDKITSTMSLHAMSAEFYACQRRDAGSIDAFGANDTDRAYKFARAAAHYGRELLAPSSSGAVPPFPVFPF